MSGSANHLLDSKTREALQRLVWRLRGRRAVSTATGSERSIFRGRGMEFDQVVKYTFGDDIRDVDWNVTARLGDLYRKCFVEEREVVVFIVFHDDPALQFGSGERSKREVAIELVCYALLLAASKRERVGLLHRSGSIEHRLQPTRDRRRILSEVVRLLKSTPPNLREACERCRQPTVVGGIPHGSLVLWLTEIPDGSPSPQWRAWSRHFDLRGLRVEDPWERSAPADLQKAIFDPIANQVVSARADEAAAVAHADWRAARERRWVGWWPDSRRRHVVDVAGDPLSQFIKMLKAGEKRR
ncbi:MAG: hypothetical protein RLY56_280 [Pseudomonadota bacterium]